MPVQLSRFPSGLLGLVGAQNFGENPRQLADVVVPTVDIGDQYMVTLQEPLFGNTAVGANGFNPYTSVPLVVPVGELWKVVAYAVNIVTAAGMSGRVGPSVRIGGAAGPNFPLGDPIAYVASETNWVYWDLDEFWAPAGYEFGASLAQVAGGSPTIVQGAIVFSRLRA